MNYSFLWLNAAMNPEMIPMMATRMAMARRSVKLFSWEGLLLLLKCIGMRSLFSRNIISLARDLRSLSRFLSQRVLGPETAESHWNVGTEARTYQCTDGTGRDSKGHDTELRAAGCISVTSKQGEWSLGPGPGLMEEWSLSQHLYRSLNQIKIDQIVVFHDLRATIP